eukprot:1160281-Pelagomonas_calceolata.AAC.2
MLKSSSLYEDLTRVWQSSCPPAKCCSEEVSVPDWSAKTLPTSSYYVVPTDGMHFIGRDSRGK